MASPAEKMRRYRLKLKENEEMQNKVKEKDKKRKVNKRVQMNGWMSPEGK